MMPLLVHLGSSFCSNYYIDLAQQRIFFNIYVLHGSERRVSLNSQYYQNKSVEPNGRNPVSVSLGGITSLLPPSDEKGSLPLAAVPEMVREVWQSPLISWGSQQGCNNLCSNHLCILPGSTGIRYTCQYMHACKRKGWVQKSWTLRAKHHPAVWKGMFCSQLDNDLCTVN